MTLPRFDKTIHPLRSTLAISKGNTFENFMPNTSMRLSLSVYSSLLLPRTHKHRTRTKGMAEALHGYLHPSTVYTAWHDCGFQQSHRLCSWLWPRLSLSNRHKSSTPFVRSCISSSLSSRPQYLPWFHVCLYLINLSIMFSLTICGSAFPFSISTFLPLR